MEQGRLNKNLKRCKTLSALRVASALSLRFKTSINKPSADVFDSENTNILLPLYNKYKTYTA